MLPRRRSLSPLPSPGSAFPASSAITFKYNPHQMAPADVLETFAGREALLERMVAHLRARRGGSGGRHLFLYGPRGIGKTTLLLVLRYTVAADPGLREAFDVVQFSEEERRIINLTSFSIRALELLAEARKDKEDDPVRARLEEARKEPERAFDLLLTASQQLDGRQALFLIDNFDDLAEAVVSRKKGLVGKDPEQALARFLSCPAFQVVAAALQSPEKRSNFPRALLDCFESPIQVEPLTDPVDFLRKRAVRDRREGFLEDLPRLAGRIDGLNRLADGNPRLLVFLYECLGDRHIPDLVEIVQRTIDNLTPMYQDVLDRLLNRGQAAVLEMLASRGGVGRTREIAELTFQDEQTVRTALGNLCDLGLVVRPDALRLPGQESNGASRETVFRTYPPLFQIWYEMRHLKSGESLYLVHFFSLLTDAEEARRTLAEGMDAPVEVRGLLESVIEVLDPISECISSVHVTEILARGGTLQDALVSLDSALKAAPVGAPERVGLFVVRSNVRGRLDDFQGAEADLKAAEATLGPAGPLEQRVKILLARSGLLRAKGETRAALGLAEAALDLCEGLSIASASDLRAVALMTLACCQSVIGEDRQALETTERAGKHLSERSSLSIQGRLAIVRGFLREKSGSLEEARADYEEALGNALTRGSLLQEAEARNNLGALYHLRGDHEQAKKQIGKALAIARSVSQPSFEAYSLVALGRLFESMGDLEQAEEHLENALAIYRGISLHGMEAMVLDHLGICLFHQGSYSQAKEYLEAALKIAEEIGGLDPTFKAGIHGNLGLVAWAEGRREDALDHLGIYYSVFQRLGSLPDRQKVTTQMVSVLLQMAADHLRQSKVLDAEGRFLEALAKADDCGTVDFLRSLVRTLIIPCLQGCPEMAHMILHFLDHARKRLIFSATEPAANLRLLETLLRFYTNGKSKAEFRDLGPTEISVIESLIDRIERPAHAEAKALLEKRDFDAARRVFEEILARSPDDLDALLNLALALINQGDFTGAEGPIGRALAIQPGLPHALFLLAIVKEQQGETEEAVDLFRKCVEVPDLAPEAFQHLADLLHNAGRFAELAEILRQWLSLEGADRDLAVWIPEAELLAGEVDRARAALPAEDSVPKDPKLQVLLGLLRVLLALASGQLEAARRHAGALLRLVSSLPPGDSSNPASPQLMGRARSLLGDREMQLFTHLVLAVRQQAPPEQLDADLLAEEDRAELTRRVAEEGGLVLEALRQGRLHRLADLFKLSTRSLGPRAGLTALGDAYPDLKPGEQLVALEILAEAATQGNTLEASAALGALGKTFARLDTDGRARSLEAILGLAERDEAEPTIRERAASLLNILYPNLTPDERRAVQARLETLRSRLQSPALGEIFRDTIPAVERKSAE